MLFIGIDPGKTGAVAIISARSKGGKLDTRHWSAEVFDWSQDVMLQLPMPGMDCLATLEAVHAFPGQGVCSSFNFGTSYGWWLGVLDSWGYKYKTVSPVKWKRNLGLIGKDKNASLALAQALYPEIANKLARKKDHGRAEALLIAHFAMKTQRGVT